MTEGLLALPLSIMKRALHCSGAVPFSLQKKQPLMRNPPRSCPVLNSGMMDDYGPSALSEGDRFMSHTDSSKSVHYYNSLASSERF